MTVGSVSSGVNSLQSLRAHSAFQDNVKNNDKIDFHEKNIEEDVKVEISSRSLKKESNTAGKAEDLGFIAKQNQFVNEIKEIANKNNLAEIEDEDINYAMQTGSSLLVNYTA